MHKFKNRSQTKTTKQYVTANKYEYK